ncbi:MAG: phage tail protein [Cyanobacteria bacterium SBLK]|nr:phage tail protein [Cyanobacteria bacterium SBLK]
MPDPTGLPPTLRTETFESLWECARAATIELDPTVVLWAYVDSVDTSVLPHLIEQFGVTGYRGGFLADTEQKKRDLVKNAISLHQKAGTLSAVVDALATLGYSVTIEENPSLTYNGEWNYGDGEVYSGKRWARFIVNFPTNPPAEEAKLINELINAWKPARSHRIDPPKILYYDGIWDYNGSQSWDGYKDG